MGQRLVSEYSLEVLLNVGHSWLSTFYEIETLCSYADWSMLIYVFLLDRHIDSVYC